MRYPDRLIASAKSLAGVNPHAIAPVPGVAVGCCQLAVANAELIGYFIYHWRSFEVEFSGR